jgi:hypothetical protein
MIEIEKFTCGKINFIDKNSQIPLIGHNAFGIIDRGTNLLQVRTTTICNLNCIFCSTDAGRFSRTRVNEFIVDKNYLLEYLERVINFKQMDDIEIHLDSVGETLTYPWLVELIKEIKKNEHIKVISMQSNGTLLDDEKIKELESAGLDRINLSINAMDEKLAKILAGTNEYDLMKVMDNARKIVESKIDLLIAPLIVQGYNENEIPKIIEFALKIGAGKRFQPIGLQNYLSYKLGRRAKIKKISMYNFYKRIKALEKKYNLKLILKPRDFGIHRGKMLPIPFKKGEKIRTKILSEGRIRGEMIGSARDRAIAIMNCNASINDIVKIEILKTKHNIITAKQIK